MLALDPSNRDAFATLQQQVREVRQVNHTVRAGESLASIAQQYYGDRSRSEVIWETNQLPPNPKLNPGMVLKIPEIPGRLGKLLVLRLNREILAFDFLPIIQTDDSVAFFKGCQRVVDRLGRAFAFECA